MNRPPEDAGRGSTGHPQIRPRYLSPLPVPGLDESLVSVPPLSPLPGSPSQLAAPGLDPLLRHDARNGLSEDQLDAWFGQERAAIPEPSPAGRAGPTDSLLDDAMLGLAGAQEATAETAVQRAVAPVDLPPGNLEQFDHRYDIVGTLGSGGISRIYRVRHRGLGKEFALKIINDTYAGDAKVREIFAREAHVLSRLNHPNIVQITDFGFDARHGAFLVMELVEGISLREELTQHGRMKLRRAVDLVLQIADALDYIHNAGVVHCDVKADNVLLVPVGHRRRRMAVKIIDFGLSRTRCLGSMQSSGGVGGTPHYMAPEQIRGAPPAPSMDIYALGVLFYELVTGELPFTGTAAEVMQSHVHVEPPSPSSRLPEPLPEELEAVIAKSLRKDPARRHATIGHFIYTLRSVAEMLGLLPPAGGAEHTGSVPGPDAEVPEGECFCARLPHPGFVLRSDGVILGANAAFAAFIRADPAELRGLPIASTLLCRAFPALGPDLTTALASARPLQRLLSFPGPDGKPVSLLLTVVPVATDPDDPIRFLGLAVPVLDGTLPAPR